MKKTFYIWIFLSLISKLGFSQSVNLVIQVNEKLVYDEVTAMYLLFGSGNEEKRVSVRYVPGDLILDEKAWALINSDTLNKFSLHFDFNTYSKNNHEIANFCVDLTKQQLKQSYLILNIYDFRDKKYRHWYKGLTDKDFLAELRYSNSGIYIRNK